MATLDETRGGMPNKPPAERVTGAGGTAGTRESVATPGTFQPRVEAEEGDPTRGDFVIGTLVVLIVVLGILWACGVIPIR